jgi:hypothetical protein
MLLLLLRLRLPLAAPPLNCVMRDAVQLSVVERAKEPDVEIKTVSLIKSQKPIPSEFSIFIKRLRSRLHYSPRCPPETWM